MKTVIFLIVEIRKFFKKTRIFLGEQAGPQHNLDCWLKKHQLKNKTRDGIKYLDNITKLYNNLYDIIINI